MILERSADDIRRRMSIFKWSCSDISEVGRETKLSSHGNEN